MPPSNKNEDSISLPALHTQIMTSISDVTQATIRLEEKLTTVVNNQTVLAKRFEKLLDNYNALLERVINIEAQDVEGIHSTIADLEREVDSIDHSIDEVERRVNSLSKYREESEKKFRELEIQGVHLGVFKKSTEKGLSTLFQVSLQIIMGILLAYISYKLSITGNAPDNK